jgi:hypothetical protein
MLIRLCGNSHWHPIRERNRRQVDQTRGCRRYRSADRPRVAAHRHWRNTVPPAVIAIRSLQPALLAPQQVQARIRGSTCHWLSQEYDALVYAREVHMDCSCVRRDADDRADFVDIGIVPLEECPHPKVFGVELIRSDLDILRRRHN